jgi:hypothetical protein
MVLPLRVGHSADAPKKRRHPAFEDTIARTPVLFGHETVNLLMGIGRATFNDTQS